MNVNDIVRVKLTPKGIDIFYHKNDDLYNKYQLECLKPKMPKIDSDGYSELALWELMNIFGKHIFSGCTIPFETEITPVLQNERLAKGTELIKEVKKFFKRLPSEWYHEVLNRKLELFLKEEV